MNKDKIKPWILERYILGELSPHKSMEIKNLLKKEKNIKLRIERLIQSNKDFLKQYPSEQILPEIMSRCDNEKNKSERKKRNVHRLFLWVSSSVSLMIVLLTIFLALQKNNMFNPESSRENSRENRAKGIVPLKASQPEIFIFRKNKDGVEQLHEGSVVNKGDLLQISYLSVNDTKGMIVSIDGNRVVTLHYPENINDSPLLQKHKQAYLENSYELDNAPDFERFFLITSNSEFDLKEIMFEVESFARYSMRIKEEELDLNDNYNQVSIILIKDKEK